MAARKIDGNWYVDFRFRRKRIRRRSPVNSYGGAQQYELALREELAKSGSLSGLCMREQGEERRPTFAEFVERWVRDYVEVKNKWSERASKQYKLRRHLLPAFGALLLDEVTTLRIDQYIAAKRREGLSAKTINNQLTILRKSLVKAVDWGELAKVPRFEFLETTPSDTRHLSPEEAERLLGACPSDPWRALVLTGIRTGLRFNELIALEWPDIDFDAKVLLVRRGEVRGHVDVPKTKRSARILPLTSDVIEVLRTLPRRLERVFVYKDRSITYGSAWWHLMRACERAGIDHTSWHPLRHTFASHLALRGVPLRPIQDLLGHTTIKMTERYTHLPAEHLREVVSVLEPQTPNAWAPTWAVKRTPPSHEDPSSIRKHQ